MSPVEHNAWAQMKAREREQRLSDPDRVPTRKPSTTSKPSGLDNNAELALLKPEPHSASPKEMPTAGKPGVMSKPNVTKKRSTTEPSMPSDRSSGSTDKKKKSKVATLRSKFSLKDLAKEYRKEIPPMSSMPKLGGSSGSGTQHTSSDSEEQSKFTHTFSEAKLYVPKTRTGDVVPNSAPPHTSEFRDSTSTDKQSILSCPSVQIPPTKGNDDRKTEAKFKHSLVHNTGVGQGTPNARLETMLLDGSSPPARTGEYNNTGQPELIRVHDRVMSLKADKNETVMPSSPRTPPPISVRSDAAAYSPSVYDTAKEVGWKAAKSSLPEENDIKPKHPFIVSSSDFKEKAREEQNEDHMFLDPREPPLPPLPLKSRDRAVRSNQVDSNAINEAQYLTGVTSHGGYAPPPPHPGYQNTVTLDQQLASHVDSLHYHLDTTVNRLARTFENGNNWSADQILKQVDSVFDLARMINTRSATQADIMKNLSQISMEARNQAYLARQETSLVEERMKSFVQQEVAKLKNELSDLILSSHDNQKAKAQGQDSRADTSHTGDQEGPKLTIGKRNQHQNKNKSRPVSAKRDALTKPTDNRNGIAENQEGKLDSGRQTETKTDKEPTPQNISDDVPTPTAAYRTPKPRIDDVVSPVPAKRDVCENPSEESSGSPKGKAGKLRISGPMPISESPSASGGGQRENSDTNRPSSPQRESESKPRRVSSSDNLKTPKKKGSVFSFRRKCDGDNQSGSRFLRTPRRTKETKSFSSQESQSPRFAISTPTKTRAAPAPLDSVTSTTSSNATANALEGAQIQRQESPSMIHPALRNSQQRQVMAERERLAQLNHHPRDSTQVQAQGQSNPHHTSHPLQNLGNRDSPSTSTSPPPSFVSFDGPNPYASATSVATSSSASFHDVIQYQSSMHYPQLPSSPSLPSQGHGLGVGQPQFFAPPPGLSPALSGENNGLGHGHGHSNISDQLDGVSIDWFGNMNMPMDTNYPDGDFF
ncbi:hypothetical protein BDV09DRAFT_85010 [Aspergillus tetrazonus]